MDTVLYQCIFYECLSTLTFVLRPDENSLGACKKVDQKIVWDVKNLVTVNASIAPVSGLSTYSDTGHSYNFKRVP